MKTVECLGCKIRLDEKGFVCAGDLASLFDIKNFNVYLVKVSEANRKLLRVDESTRNRVFVNAAGVHQLIPKYKHDTEWFKWLIKVLETDSYVPSEMISISGLVFGLSSDVVIRRSPVDPHYLLSDVESATGVIFKGACFKYQNVATIHLDDLSRMILKSGQGLAFEYCAKQLSKLIEKDSV
jgi:hypothetical protein